MSTDFDRAARRAGFALDPAQRAVADRLAALGRELTRRRPARGVYLWGPVGRGKTWLTTTFFQGLPLESKRRLHFHDFFRRFHAACARHLAEADAVDRAVDELLGGVRFLCFDEFHVHDPGDAMLLSRLLTSLFRRGVVLLTTSNHPPERLLPDPMYHHLFEPAIALLTAELDVVELTGERDYRTVGADVPRSEFERGHYLWPGGEDGLREVGLTPPAPGEAVELAVNGRRLTADAVRDGLVWFDFHRLCATPTSTVDYLVLAESFSHWVISGLPVLGPRSKDAAQRFANVVDVLCDRDVRLTLVADAPLERVLRDAALPLDVDRTVSRLSLLGTPVGR
ncbi:cell division protein ZapE [Saccharothrix australiensis]|uniref:Cell division protein ZapE n=1 Tax=Saccharothrix australiensis TaxID=2072 RepID=A0A495VVM3_9PSEU|nr:cell division protein ZapE [Saccharothrix australiensis]RKT52415.1 cell division protein ZapE [Saccharothrix australiensis]